MIANFPSSPGYVTFIPDASSIQSIPYATESLDVVQPVTLSNDVSDFTNNPNAAASGTATIRLDQFEEAFTGQQLELLPINANGQFVTLLEKS